MKGFLNKFIVRFGGILAALALMATVESVNSTCIWLIHQPELPQGADRLRKSY